jgi:hypothetical protein
LLWRFPFFLYLAAALMLTASVEAMQADQQRAVGEDALALDHHADPATQRDLLAEVVKQAAEQPLHFVMSAGPIWLSRCLTAVPWYGWVAVPALAYREWRQWPSKRWWDPALDATFLALGVLTATWSGTPLPLAVMRRRDWRNALTRLAPGVIRRPVSAER